MIVTRFPPSPTGFVHVGSLRTALYSYLFARKNKGKFLIRIEDTDQKRYVEGAVENLLSTLKWAGLEYDEGPEVGGPHAPYYQSQRTELYKKNVQDLLKNGTAYYCFCTSERLDEMRQGQERRKEAPMYDRHCTKFSEKEIEEKIKSEVPYVIRQKIPQEKILILNDLIRGKVRFDGRVIDDQVLMKSDGFPTYHLANVIDDHDMEITHVIRGEEWLSSTPKHIWLYEAFGWTPPQFAHIPLLLNADRSKLSKRQGDVAVEDYIKKGYSKEAIINFIALLGWHPGKGIEKEIYSLPELVEAFSLEGVHKAGAIFDIQKLDWFNWQWTRRKIEEKLEKIGNTLENRAKLLLELCEEYLEKDWLKDKNLLARALKTVEEKITQNPKEVRVYLQFYFQEPEIKKELICSEKMKVDTEIAKKVSAAAGKKLETISPENFTEEEIKKSLIEVVTELGLKNGQIFWPVRAGLTGEQFSPGVFEVIWALGKEKTLERLKKLEQI
ncbi:MAG: glutamate--tRNA ligase [Patescibacteria group bacterium]